MKIVETFESIQGESSFVGRPCLFVRAHGCNLSCKWPCDTLYAKEKDNFVEVSSKDIIELCKRSPARVVQLTGGEPLLQSDEVVAISQQVKEFKTVLIETNGTVSIEPFKRAPKNVHVIMDIKTPSSGMHFYEEEVRRNTRFLRRFDEVKFVVGNREDFNYAAEKIEEFGLVARVGEILISPVFGMIDPTLLAEWVLKEMPFARLQIQLYKLLKVR